MSEKERVRAGLTCYQAETQHVNSTERLGLGLSIANRIVSLLGHQMHITSTPDVGTTVSLMIPCKSEQPSVDAVPVNVLEETSV